MLDGMNQRFENPYVIFYPAVSRDGMPFPINESIKKIQGSRFNETHAWRGNIIIAKYCDEHLSSPMKATMADYPLLSNYLLTHKPPVVVTVSPFLHLHNPSQLTCLIMSFHALGFCVMGFLMLIYPPLPPRAPAERHTQVAPPGT